MRKRKRGPAATPCSPLHPSSLLSFLLSSCSTWSSLPSPVSLPEPSDRPPSCRPPPRQSSPRPHRSERSPPPPSGGRLPALEHTRSVLSSSYIPQSDNRELNADSSASSCLALLVALGFGCGTDDCPRRTQRCHGGGDAQGRDRLCHWRGGCSIQRCLQGASLIPLERSGARSLADHRLLGAWQLDANRSPRASWTSLERAVLST